MSVMSSSAPLFEGRELPPGPRRKLRATLAFQRSPLQFLSRMIEDHGDIFSLDLLGMPMVLINHPDHVDHILRTRHRNYDRGGPAYDIMRTLFGAGLTVASRPGWLLQRRLLQPAFHRERVAAFGELMTDTVESILDGWEQTQGRPVDLRAEMNRLALRVVVRALFAMDPADAMIRRFTDAVDTATEELAAYLRFPLVPLSVPTPGHRRFHRALRVVNEITHEVIRQHRRDEHDRGSLLSMMMRARDEDTGEGMSDTQLRDEVFAMLFAGHETSASTLTWAWYLIGRHPEVEQRLRAEVDTVLGGRRPTMDDLPQLSYTRRVIDETLRLYPPGWQLVRQAAHEDEIGGYRIPAGSTIFFSSYFVHRHPDFWDAPERFDPDRFADSEGGRRDRLGYFPFGAGPRLCIGNVFAMAEMQFTLAMTVQRYRFVPSCRTPIEPKALITLGMAEPFTVHLEPPQHRVATEGFG
ncbi:cytochrome P450 [Nocardia spumae]|uniref:cytochrome P450 n=1 Tax=Nocardia spumae TaxID=2887190 RepID=UPI001D1553F1|nr:cytochrome P450 [Nocardia spumae]